ncbi:MAG: class I SAM-dependent methyltransferase [Gammaproteobacteria bacterium]|nr:class I SAM-dependent methyltransferase [Gammaproteobacteria bacterium]MBT8152076.1 class I SAM-dependent methyltransferase [Gammaproteobacteria bacterium]NNM10341.1 class I SAM-dependent methyltransferase [Pseudomonadales bacterium]RZV54245.1 MAG: class I SAM-dependent methyltransferase [Pseudomonadales bacterium]
MLKTLSRDEVIRFYDKFGAKQDQQGFYEDAALNLMIELGRFTEAENVFEFGCGTGKLAERLLSTSLPATAHYAGTDISSTMVRLAKTRLSGFEGRTKVQKSDGGFDVSHLGGAFDRIVCTYVLDLLSPSDIKDCLAGAHAAMNKGGLFCHAGLTKGVGPISKITSSAWTLVHRINPSLVGGCRPLMLNDYLPAQQWERIHREVVVSSWIASEVVILKAR